MVNLVCPQCMNKNQWHDDIDASKEIACTSCGFADVPTKFELAEGASRQDMTEKLLIVILIAIGFATGELLAGLVLVAFLAPIAIPIGIYFFIQETKPK